MKCISFHCFVWSFVLAWSVTSHSSRHSLFFHFSFGWWSSRRWSMSGTNEWMLDRFLVFVRRDKTFFFYSKYQCEQRSTFIRSFCFRMVQWFSDSTPINSIKWFKCVQEIRHFPNKIEIFVFSDALNGQRGSSLHIWIYIQFWVFWKDFEQTFSNELRTNCAWEILKILAHHYHLLAIRFKLKLEQLPFSCVDHTHDVHSNVGEFHVNHCNFIPSFNHKIDSFPREREREQEKWCDCSEFNDGVERKQGKKTLKIKHCNSNSFPLLHLRFGGALWGLFILFILFFSFVYLYFISKLIYMLYVYVIDFCHYRAASYAL